MDKTINFDVVADIYETYDKSNTLIEKRYLEVKFRPVAKDELKII